MSDEEKKIVVPFSEETGWKPLAPFRIESSMTLEQARAMNRAQRDSVAALAQSYLDKADEDWTYVDPEDIKRLARAVVSAGAPVPEIEVTPAMIEAGLDAFAGFNENFESRDDMVERVFLAMLQSASGEPLTD